MNVANLVTAIDAHACGEPGRVITGGVLDVPGATMLQKQRFLARHRDSLRKLMLREPRGYPALCCNVLLPPCHPGADAGFVIMEQTEYPAMSGSNTICVVTVLLETGMLPAVEPRTDLVLETPAGLVKVQAEVADGRVTGVTFENVPAFAAHLGATLEVPHLGTVTVDVAWGGMFYVIAEAEAVGVDLAPTNGRRIAQVGEMLRQAAAEQLPVAHPEEPAIAGVSIAQLAGPATLAHAHRRNAVVVSTGPGDWSRPESFGGVLDRSPCGTGTCATMAVLHARGTLPLGQDFVHEGPLGTTFTGRLIRETRVGDRPAIVPTLSGRGWITGMHQFVVDPDDPFPEGFTLGDIW